MRIEAIRFEYTVREDAYGISETYGNVTIAIKNITDIEKFYIESKSSNIEIVNPYRNKIYKIELFTVGDPRPDNFHNYLRCYTYPFIARSITVEDYRDEFEVIP